MMCLRRSLLIVSVFAWLVLGFNALAVPADPTPFKLRQPNGTEITLRVRGDEWFHWYETLEGRPVTLDAVSGYWMYSSPSDAEGLVASNQRVGLDLPATSPWQPKPSVMRLNTLVVKETSSRRTMAARTSGTGFVPVLLGNFSDTTPTVSAVTLSNILFATGPGVRSMSTYFSEISYGKFTVSSGPSGVQNWVNAPNTAAFYGATNPARANAVDIRAAQFVRAVVQAAIASGYNFAPYDQDGDGKVDVVNIVHTGRGEESGGGPNTIWSHRSSLKDQLGTNGPIVAPGGIVIDDYVIQPELAGDGGATTIGVFVHEHGHALGLPDLYDSDYSSLGVGKWSGMSFGSNNGLVRGGDCPAHFDPWCKAKLGWLTPVNYTLNYQNVPFPSASSNAFAARLWKDGLAGPQYYLVENRQTNGFDAALPSAGLLIWHIDESKVKVSNTQEWYPISLGGSPARTNSGNYVVSLIQADNLWNLEVTNRNPSLGNTGDAGDPFPGTSNNRVFGPNTSPSSASYNVGTTPGINSFVTVSNISASGPVMTADLYSRSPNSGPLVEWVNIAGYAPPYSGAQFSRLDAQHPVAIRAFPGQSGSGLSVATLFITRVTDGRWWNFTSKLWETNATGRDVPVTGVQQNGFTLGFQSDLPEGTNLVNGVHTFIVRVINAANIVTELQMAMAAAHAPEVRLSLADNAVVNTLTNFTAVATEDSGIGVQRVEIALYYDSEVSDGGPATRWYWDGNSWTTTPLWLGADFPGHPGQATLYYPIGPSSSDLLTEHEYIVSARAVDAFGDAATNTVSVFYDTGSPATIYWRYPSSGNWFDAANWNPSRVPDATDHAVVNTPGDYTVTVNGNASVASLRFGCVVGLDRQQLAVPVGGGLTLTSADTNKVYGRASVDLGGGLAPGRLQVSGGAVWNWTNGALGGFTSLRPGATMNIVGAANKTLASGAILDNAGTVNWAGPGLVYNYGLNSFDRATISNKTYATFNLTTDGQVFHHDYNESFFYNSAGALLVKSDGASSNLMNHFMFFNSGEVRVDSGALKFGGTSVFDSGTVLGGSGAVLLTGSSSIKAPVVGTASLRMEGGVLTTSGSAGYGGSAGMDWTGGTMVGPFSVVPGSKLRISGPATKVLGSGSVLNNGGAVTWAGPGTVYNYGLNGFDRATFNNLSNATFSILTDGQVFSHDYGPSWFNNQKGATFRKTGGGGTNLVNHFIFNNAGEMSAALGTVEFNETLNLGGGGVLKGPGQFLISGGTTTLSNLTTINTALVTMTAGALAGDAPSGAALATVSGGAFDWAGGTLAGTVDVVTGSTFGISGPAQKNMGSGAVLNNSGAVTWSGSGNIYNYGLNGFDRATINVLSGGSFNVTGNAAFTYDYNPSFFNVASNATFSKTGGGGPTTINWWFNNNGAASSQNGTLSLAAGGNSAGSYAVGSGALLRFTGGTHSLSNGVSVTGAGRMQIDGATVLLNGWFTLGSTVQTLEWDLVSGTLGGSGTWLGKFVGTWTGGTIGGLQNITTGGALVVTDSGTKTLGSGAYVSNYGTITWFGPGPIYNYGLNGFDRATLFNHSNAVFRVASDGQVFAHDYNPSSFYNLEGALFVKTAGANASTINHFVFNSLGEIRAETGSLLFDYVLSMGHISKLSGGAPIRLAGSTTVYGTLTSSANLRLEAGSLTAAPSAVYTGGGAFDWTGGAIGGVLTLAPGTVMNISGPARKDLGSGVVLTNQGTINWTGPGTIYNYGLNGFDLATINNQSSGRFNIADDGQVFSHDYGLSTFNNLPGARVAKTAGSGTSTINHLVFNSPGEVRVDTGNLFFDSVATFGPNGTLNGNGLVRWAGDIRLSSNVTSTAAVRLEGGALTGQSGASYGGTGALNWTGGTVAGTVAFVPGSVVDITGAATKTLGSGAVVNNRGSVNWSGPGTIYNYGLNGFDRATFNNLSDGTFNLASDGPVFAYDYNPSFLNNSAGARLRKTSGSGTASINYAFANSGAVEILAGTIHTSGAYVSSAASSELALVMGGTQPVTGFTRQTAAGAMPLAGTLKVTLANGFVPTTGATFAILDYASRSGEFATLQLPPLSLGKAWKVDYGATGMTLSVEQGILAANLAKNAGGTFEFDLTGPVASSYIIQGSTNLTDWISIQTNTPFTGSFHFSDPQATTMTNRFYRVLVVP